MAGNTPTMENLTHRLDRLERENRRLKWACTALALRISTAVAIMDVRMSADTSQENLLSTLVPWELFEYGPTRACQ